MDSPDKPLPSDTEGNEQLNAGKGTYPVIGRAGRGLAGRQVSPSEPNPSRAIPSEVTLGESMRSEVLPSEFSSAKPSPEIHQPNPNENVQHHRIRFTGSANEYFRIWIVNVFLTIITLGIYNAWAKVRTRQYFYAHTKLDGHAFEYLAQPLSILKGNLILGVGVVAYYLSQMFIPWLSFVLLAVFAIIYPWLIYKSLRFRAHHSAYRNIRFRFHGEAGESYTSYLWLALLIPFTFGLIIPYMMFRQKRFFFGNFSYGKRYSTFKAQSGEFFKTYILGYGIMILVNSVFGFLFVFGLGATTRTLEDTPGLGTYIMLGAGYLVFGIIGIAIQQMIAAMISNYCWNNTELLGKIRFKSTLSVWDMIKLRLTNTLAIIVSLGLLTPWVQVRTAQYTLSHLSVISNGGLDDFVATATEQEDALGDAAADFFEFDIGL